MSTLDLTRKSRKVACVATLTAAGLSFGLVACGDNSPSGDASTATASEVSSASGTTGATGNTGGMPQGTPPGGLPGGPVQLTATQEQCLTEKGVDLPETSSGDGQTPPDEGSMPDPEEMSAAFEACDIDVPEPPSGQQGQGMPQPPSGSQNQDGTMPAIPSQSS